MKKLITATIACILASPLAPALIRADSFEDATPIYRNVNSANSGPEVIMRRETRFGTDPNGHPLGYRFWFDVYRAGQTSLLYSTGTRAFSLPRPCTNPQPGYSFYSENEKLVALPNSSWTNLVMTVSLGCVETTGGLIKRGSAIFLYSADAASSGGGVWTKTFTVPPYPNGTYLESFQGVDTNGDGKDDSLMLLMSYEAINGYNRRLILLNQITGAVISSSDYVSTRVVP